MTLSLGGGYRFDNRYNIFGSFRGKAGLVGFRQTFNLGGPIQNSYPDLTASILHLFPLASQMAIATRLRLDYQGAAAPKHHKLQLGSLYSAARSYLPSDFHGTGLRATGTAEYRQALSFKSTNNLLGLFTVTQIQGAVFSDLVYFPQANLSCDKSWFVDIGYSIRFLADILAIAPSALHIDLGFPLRSCEQDLSDLPFTLNFSFVQSLASF